MESYIFGVSHYLSYYCTILASGTTISKMNHYFFVHKCIHFCILRCYYMCVFCEQYSQYRHTSITGMPMCAYVEWNMYLFVPHWRFCKHCCSLHPMRHAITSCTQFLPHTHSMFVCERKKLIVSTSYTMHEPPLARLYHQQSADQVL